MHRGQLRMEMKQMGFSRKGAAFKSQDNVVPPPHICNRTATGWKAPEASCQCERWPGWLAHHAHSKAQIVDGAEIIDVERNVREVKKGDKVLYWQMGKEKKKWWYDGVIADLVKVTFPSGQQKVLLGMN